MKIEATQECNYLITAMDRKKKHVLRTEVWHPSRPFPLDYPISWVLEKTSTGIRIRNLLSKPNEWVESSFEELTFEKLEKTPFIYLSNIILRIQSIPNEADLIHHREKWKPKLVQHDTLQEEHEDQYFKKSVMGVLIASFGLTIVVSLWPKPEQTAEEIIPPQFAKVLLSPAFNRDTPNETKPSNTSQAKNQRSIVQAFQSEVVQKSAQKLIQGGAMTLLARSDILGAAASRKQVSTLFDAKSKLGKVPVSADKMNPKSVSLALLGGAGSENSKNNIGYKKWTIAAVKGQGSSFVSLDTREAVVEEGLTADEVGKVIHSHLSEIRYCYESSMVRNSGIEGKLTVNFTIQSTGVIKSAHIKDSSLTDPNLEQCIISHLVTWKFPKPKGGVDVDVSYPFIFKTLEG